MTESQTLLADYAGNGSEAAFRELVARCIDFVYSAAQDIARFKKELMARASEMFSQTSRLRLVDEKADSPGEMTILLSYEGQGVAQKFRLKKPGQIGRS